MAFYVEEDEERSYDLDGAVGTPRDMEYGEEVILYGIRVVRHACCYSLWSVKGMMRLGLGVGEGLLPSHRCVEGF